MAGGELSSVSFGCTLSVFLALGWVGQRPTRVSDTFLAVCLFVTRMLGQMQKYQVSDKGPETV